METDIVFGWEVISARIETSSRILFFSEKKKFSGLSSQRLKRIWRRLENPQRFETKVAKLGFTLQRSFFKHLFMLLKEFAEFFQNYV